MKSFIAFFFLSLYFGGIAAIVTDNLLIGGLIFGAYFLVFALFINPVLKRFFEKKRKKHEGFHFINRFIISLSVTTSLDQAYLDSTSEAIGEEKEVFEGIEPLLTMEKLDYLSRYFEDDIYQVFLSIVRLYQEEGGNLLDIASSLLEEATRNEEKQNSLEASQSKSLIQFGSMWFLSTLILVFLRYGLANFYDVLTANLPYLLTAVAYFLVAIASFYVYSRAYTGEKATSERKRAYVQEKA